MKKHTAVALAASLLITAILTASGLAMSSTHYNLDRYAFSTNSGGGRASSASYVMNATIGQVAIGSADSAHYATGLGYWYSLGIEYFHVHVPFIRR